MADDRFDAHAPPLHERLPWLELFRTFRVALDPKKLLLAAVGILVMSCGWWFFSWVFYVLWPQPTLTNYVDEVPSKTALAKRYSNKSEKEIDDLYQSRVDEKKREFDGHAERWLHLHMLAGSGFAEVTYSNGTTARAWGGRMRTMPWDEDRGPNPYLLVTRQVEQPWEQGRFAEWFLTVEVPVLIEPLVKFLEPIIQLLNPKHGTYTRIYLLIVLFWTLATWALFGGMITRMASVELAGKDPVTVWEAFRFTLLRYWSYLCAPLVPIGLITLLVIFSILFGLLHLIPGFGDFWSGILWPVMILFGLGMALLLVGLVGYPLMYPTISVEGSDTLDALSRSYNYVYQSPWSYLWYCVVAVFYGAIVVFFVGFMGSLTVYLGKWAISNTPFIESADRKPEFLFIYTPKSFGWRPLLLKDSKGEALATLEEEEAALRRRGKDHAEIDRVMTQRGMSRAKAEYDEWLETFYLTNKIGAVLVAFWVTLLFMCVLGFGYSFFWTASTMIYLLMRRKVDDTDLDEVYSEETTAYEPYAPPTTPLPMTPPPSTGGAPVMVDAPSLRTDKGSPPANPAGDSTPPTPPPPTTPSS
jgi:hypothetical protein